MAASLVKKIDVPLVITEHSSAMNCENVNESLQKCALKGYKMAARVVAVSHPYHKISSVIPVLMP